MQRFNEYIETQTLEDLLLESMGATADAGDQGIVKKFVNSLSQYLPRGLGSISGLWGKLKTLFSRPTDSFTISKEDLMGEPSQALIDAAVKRRGVENAEEARYWLTVFNRQMLQSIDPQEMNSRNYFNAFDSWLQNPRAGNFGTMLNNPPMGAEEPRSGKEAVVDAAQEIKASTNDPQVHAAVDAALAEVLSDQDLRAISLHDRRTKAGRDAVSSMLPGDRTHDDFSDEMRNNPEFAQRMRNIRQKRYRRLGSLGGSSEE